MNSYSTERRSHRSRGGSRRRGNGPARRQRGEAKEQKKTFWQRIAAFFGNGTTKAEATARNGAQPSRSARKPERIDVTSPRLYVGNLSFDATESDLFELFNGVGHVQNAEVVSYRHNQRSKGFAFVQMQTVDEAKRAVEELHDKEFLGRRGSPDFFYSPISRIGLGCRGSLSFNLQIRSGQHVIGPRLEFFDAHLF
ncbi:MAG: hypothetical protein DMF20_01475 [Verrucomicrobia bacterium]|nr:MAG: hypothetical protein DMF20_01475 [Verrucomicrobiota bacterium]